MAYQYRGQLKNSKQIVDIIEFDNSVAICTDNINRDIDEFNTIFYGAQKFKEEILGILEPNEEIIEENVQEKKTKKVSS